MKKSSAFFGYLHIFVVSNYFGFPYTFYLESNKLEEILNMAYKMLLKHGEMPFIWNVTKSVGCSQDSMNDSGDVELVNFFLDFVRSESPVENRQKVVNDEISINEIFNAASGFWLFFTQRSRQVHLSATCAVDGKVSSATRADKIAFTIVYLNSLLFHRRRQVFDTLATNQKLSANLRNQLTFDMF